jgi:hypothetical protein
MATGGKIANSNNTQDSMVLMRQLAIIVIFFLA